MDIPVIIIATTNDGKVREIAEILKEIFPNTIFKSLKDINCNRDVEEDKDTFKGNAIKKSVEYFEMLGIPCIADDSGLSIDEYDGWPGVKTARFLGEGKTPRDRNIFILEKMKDLVYEQRKAKHITAISFTSNNKDTYVVEGITEGYISFNIRGKIGFGFDEIFELPDGRTQAELDSLEKNEISARKKALLLLKDEIKNM
jgi:non-canonical purine NTP pyrophosphatase, rdgB/HAM1 family